MTKRLFISLPILACFFSCQSNKDSSNQEYADVNGEKIPIIRLDLVDDSATTIPLSVLFEDVKIVPLETKSECLIGYFSKQMTDHSVLIAARGGRRAIRLYEFDLEGKFIREFGGIGQGPGEHSGSYMGKITYYPKAEMLMASFYGGPDENHIFNSNGEFIKSITPIGDLFGGVLRHSDELYMTAGNIAGIPRLQRDSFQLVLSNANGDWLKSFPRRIYPEESNNGFSMHSGESFWRYLNSWMLYSQGDDTVYQITREALLPKAIFQLGSNSFRYNQIVDPKSEVGRYDVKVLLENDLFYYFKKDHLEKMKANLIEPGWWGTLSTLKYSIIIYDKMRGSGYNLRFRDDILGILPLEKRSMKLTWDEFGTVYRIAQAVDVLDWIAEAKESNSLPEKARERILELESSIDENSNPVMFIYQEKDQRKLGSSLADYFK